MDKLFEKHGKNEDFGEKMGDNPLKIAETRFENAKTRLQKAKTRFQNSETAMSRISFASTWMEIAQKNCLYRVPEDGGLQSPMTK